MSYAVEKRGNKVTHINFHVRPKKDVYERLETWEKIDGALRAEARGRRGAVAVLAVGPAHWAASDGHWPPLR